MRSELLRAVHASTTQAELAARVGVTPAAVTQWISGHRRVPEARCPAIERATGGLVTCEQLRSDVSWVRVADASWPWHPEGRPLLDVSAPSNPPAEAVNV